MVASLETSSPADSPANSPATEPDAPAAIAAKRGRGRLAAGAALLAVAAGLVGWQAPRVVGELTEPKYLGEPAAAVAADLRCENYAQATEHDESVYRYHDQGTCSLDGTVVTITTFDRASDGRAFESVMRALIPVVHPTWEGATYAAGEGWNVADARNLTPAAATLAVQRLGTGETKLIPFKR